MKIKLTVINTRGGEIPFLMEKNPFVIGRQEGCDFLLESRTVSRRHCELKLKRSGLTIKDLGSRNGTLVNGVIATTGIRVPINEGDELRIGKYLVKVGGMIVPTVEPNTDQILASLDELFQATLEPSTGYGQVASAKNSDSKTSRP